MTEEKKLVRITMWAEGYTTCHLEDKRTFKVEGVEQVEVRNADDDILLREHQSDLRPLVLEGDEKPISIETTTFRPGDVFVVRCKMPRFADQAAADKWTQSMRTAIRDTLAKAGHEDPAILIVDEKINLAVLHGDWPRVDS